MKIITLGCLLLLSPMTALANETPAPDVDNADEFSFEEDMSNQPDQACWQFDGKPRLCENYGCNFNYRTQRCVQGINNRRPWICTAADQRWEEHYSGHQGRGWSRLEASRNAERVCERYHGTCIVTECSQY